MLDYYEMDRLNVYNSDGLPVIFMVYHNVNILNVSGGTFYQFLPYIQNKNLNRKNIYTI